MQLERYGEFPKQLPIIIEEDMFLYPFMIVPLFIGDEESIKAIDVAIEGGDKLIFITASKNRDNDEEESFYDVGVIGTIMRRVVLPEGRVKILFQGLSRGSILGIVSKSPLVGEIAPILSSSYDASRVEAILSVLKEKLRTLYSVSQMFPQDLLRSINETMDPNRAADLIASAARLKKEQAYKVFKENDPEERLVTLIDIIMEEYHCQGVALIRGMDLSKQQEK